MTGTASLSFDQASEQVEGLLQQGAAFARVEDAIDAARFSHLHKAALWLLAWSLRDPTLQRRDARLMAQGFKTGGENQPPGQSPPGMSDLQPRSTAASRDRHDAR